VGSEKTAYQGAWFWVQAIAALWAAILTRGERIIEVVPIAPAFGAAETYAPHGGAGSETLPARPRAREDSC
jgi:hypothetical protein